MLHSHTARFNNQFAHFWICWDLGTKYPCRKTD